MRKLWKGRLKNVLNALIMEGRKKERKDERIKGMKEMKKKGKKKEGIKE